jgi:hypothetical protein
MCSGAMRHAYSQTTYTHSRYGIHVEACSYSFSNVSNGDVSVRRQLHRRLAFIQKTPKGQKFRKEIASIERPANGQANPLLSACMVLHSNSYTTTHALQPLAFPRTRTVTTRNRTKITQTRLLDQSATANVDARCTRPAIRAPCKGAEQPASLDGRASPHLPDITCRSLSFPSLFRYR